jgi:hypothetical protein
MIRGSGSHHLAWSRRVCDWGTSGGRNVDVWRITLAALRRWSVLLPLLGVTVLFAMVVGNGVAPEYEARASAMLTPERALSENTPPNPYGSITSATEALGIVLNGVESRGHVADSGLAGSYEVGTAPRSPIVQFSARGPDPEAVVETGNMVFELAVEELSARQSDAGLPEASQYTLQILEPPAVVSVVQTGKTRIQAVIGVVGAAGALLVAVLFDDIVGLFKNRRRGKRARGDGRQTVAGEVGEGDAAEVEAVAGKGEEGDTATVDPAMANSEDADREGDAETTAAGARVSSGDDRPPLIRPPEADDAAVIHTDQWLWPPFFDTEFTKRSRAKAAAKETLDEAPAEVDVTERSANDAKETAQPSGPAHRS